jgi:hypothetical protein
MKGGYVGEVAAYFADVSEAEECRFASVGIPVGMCWVWKWADGFSVSESAVICHRDVFSSGLGTPKPAETRASESAMTARIA